MSYSTGSVPITSEVWCTLLGVEGGSDFGHGRTTGVPRIDEEKGERSVQNTAILGPRGAEVPVGRDPPQGVVVVVEPVPEETSHASKHAPLSSTSHRGVFETGRVRRVTGRGSGL